MDQKFTLNTQRYYDVEPENSDNGLWKRYEEGEFEIVKDNIGRATTGKVHLMRHKRSTYLGIMKVMTVGRACDFGAELEMLKLARGSRFLIRVLDGFKEEAGDNKPGPSRPTFYIFLEYAPFKTLDHLTQAVKGVGAANARLYAFEIASALEYLHGKQIMHRDVKPENVFVRVTGHVALGDMGMAMDASQGSNKISGTFLTRPPEMWLRERYSLPVDVWMFGVSLYNLICNKWPFAAPGKERQIQKVKDAKLSFEPKFSNESSDLISKTVQADPNNRLLMKQVLQHQYFQGVHPNNPPPYSPEELLNTHKFDELERRIVSQTLG